MPDYVCKSWPHCNETPAPGSEFCVEHRDLFARVKEEYDRESSKRSRHPINGTLGKPAAPVTVTHVEPKAGSPARVTEAFKETILQALEADGPLTGRQLARAAKAKSTDRSFARARLSLLQDGRIAQTDGGTAAKQYELVGQP